MTPTPIEDVDGRPRCRTCGEYVSHSFLRVFGGNDDSVAACLNCTSARELGEGAAVTE